jgi:hypothetical protein
VDTIDETKDLLLNLPDSEKQRIVRSIAALSALPESLQVRLLSATTEDAVERAKCYKMTGNLPEQIEREHERRSTMLTWFVFLLFAALFFWWDRDTGVPIAQADTATAYGCDDGTASCVSDDPSAGLDDRDMWGDDSGWGDD